MDDIKPTKKPSVVEYTSRVGDFTVKLIGGNEVHINRYSTVALQNHQNCEEVRELRDILNHILGEG